MTDLITSLLYVVLILLAIMLIANIVGGSRGQRIVSNLMTVGGCCVLWIAAVVGSILMLLSVNAK